MTILWCMVPEKPSTTDRIFIILDHFFALFPLTTRKIKIWKNGKKNTWRYYHFTHVYHSWDMDNDGDNFCHFEPFFALLPPSQPKNAKSWKNGKKRPGDIIILHKCTINDNHIICGSWDIKHDRQNVVILDRFLPFHPCDNLKNQNFEKLKKKAWRYHQFTQVHQKSLSYGTLFLRYGT